MQSDTALAEKPTDAVVTRTSASAKEDIETVAHGSVTKETDSFTTSTTCWQAFRAGFLQRTWQTCLASVLFAAFVLACCCFTVTPQLLAKLDAGYLRNHPWDDLTTVTCRVHQMHSEPFDSPGVVYAGMSMVREAIHDDRLVNSQILERCDVPIEFFNLGTSWQSLWESVAVLDNLPPNFRGLVLVGVAPCRFAAGKAWLEQLVESPQLAISSPMFDTEVQQWGLPAPSHSGIFLLDHAKFFTARRKWPLRILTGPSDYRLHRYTGQTPWTEDYWQLAKSRTTEWMDGVDENMEAHLRMMGRMVERLQARSIDVVFSESTLHPRARQMCGVDRYAKYKHRIKSFCAAMDVDYWQLQADARLEAADFHDWVHLSSEDGQKRFQQAMVNRIAEKLTSTYRNDGNSRTIYVREGQKAGHK